jgi:hypothetical protein
MCVVFYSVLSYFSAVKIYNTGSSLERFENSFNLLWKNATGYYNAGVEVVNSDEGLGPGSRLNAKVLLLSAHEKCSNPK